MRKVIISGILVVLALSGFIIACGGGGGGGGGGGTVAISASLDSSYTIAYAPTFLDNLKGIFFAPDAMALSSGTTVDKVVAIPTWRGAYGPANLVDMKTATIDSGGGFTLNLDTSYEWVLLLVNTAAGSKAERVAGYVAATVDDNNTLIAFAGSQMASDLSLGTLTKSSGEAKSSTSGAENAAAFDLSLDQLISLGKSDDGYKHLINLYLNYDPATGDAYALQPSFAWDAGSVEASTAAIAGTVIESYALPKFALGIETAAFSLNDSETRNNICGGNISFGMYLPIGSTMNDGMYLYGGDTGIVNDNSGTGDTGFRNIGNEHSDHWGDDDNRKYYCYDDDFSISSHYGSTGTLIGFGRDGHSLPVPESGFPEGMWELRMGDTAIAEFDFAVGSPVNTDSKITTVPVPAIKVNYLPTAGTLTSVEIEWFQYNPGTDKYEKMSATERAAFESSYLLLNSVFDIQEHTPADISFYPPESQPHYQNQFITYEDLTVYDQTWYLPGSPGDNGTNYAADSISVQMEMGGVHYLFGWD